MPSFGAFRRATGSKQINFISLGLFFLGRVWEDNFKKVQNWKSKIAGIIGVGEKMDGKIRIRYGCTLLCAKQAKPIKKD
jgi:hypothetical protein